MPLGLERITNYVKFVMLTKDAHLCAVIMNANYFFSLCLGVPGRMPKCRERMDAKAALCGYYPAL